MFKKRNWTKWEHVMFVEDSRAGFTTYELFKRTDINSGLSEWKKVYVSKCVHSLTYLLTEWDKSKTLTPNTIEK